MVALAQAEHELGLKVLIEQRDAIESPLNVAMAKTLKHEREVRLNVMAHIRAF